jgi:hypothetical protein
MHHIKQASAHRKWKRRGKKVHRGPARSLPVAARPSAHIPCRFTRRGPLRPLAALLPCPLVMGPVCLWPVLPALSRAPQLLQLASPTSCPVLPQPTVQRYCHPLVAVLPAVSPLFTTHLRFLHPPTQFHMTDKHEVDWVISLGRFQPAASNWTAANASLTGLYPHFTRVGPPLLPCSSGAQTFSCACPPINAAGSTLHGGRRLLLAQPRVSCSVAGGRSGHEVGEPARACARTIAAALRRSHPRCVQRQGASAHPPCCLLCRCHTCLRPTPAATTAIWTPTRTAASAPYCAALSCASCAGRIAGWLPVGGTGWGRAAAHLGTAKGAPGRPARMSRARWWPAAAVALIARAASCAIAGSPPFHPSTAFPPLYRILFPPVFARVHTCKRTFAPGHPPAAAAAARTRTPTSS